MTTSHAVVKTDSHNFFADNTRMKKPDKTFWMRLQESMADKGLETDNVTVAAALIGKHQTAATKWKKGGYPSMTNTVALAKELGVCVEWLLTGNGDKRPLESDQDDLQAVIDAWGYMSEDLRGEVVGAARLAQRVASAPDPSRHAEIERRIEKFQAKNGRAKLKPKK